MINFSLNNHNHGWNLRKAVYRSVDESYLKHFHDAVLNLELNLQEERIRRDDRLEAASS